MRGPKGVLGAMYDAPTADWNALVNSVKSLSECIRCSCFSWHHPRRCRWLDHNRIQELPESFGQLTGLKRL